MSTKYSYNDLLVIKSKLFHRFVQRGGKIPADVFHQQHIFYTELSFLTSLQVDMLLENKPVPLDAGTPTETTTTASDTPQSQQSTLPSSVHSTSTADAAMHRHSLAQLLSSERSSTLSINSAPSFGHQMNRYPNTYSSHMHGFCSSSTAGNGSFYSISTPPQAATGQAPSEGIRSKSALAFTPSFLDVADKVQVRDGCEVDPGLRFSALSYSDYNRSPAPFSEYRFPLPDLVNSRAWYHLGRNSTSPELGIEHPIIMEQYREELAEFYRDLEREMSQASVKSIQSKEDQSKKEKAVLSELSQRLETHLKRRAKAITVNESARPKLAVDSNTAQNGSVRSPSYSNIQPCASGSSVNGVTLQE